MSERNLSSVIQAMETSDGAGVRLRRSIGQSPQARLDPFLMLDEFGTDNPQDYIAGFPAHPHRGFETVTYMLDGHMLHEDHLGNRGDLKSGDVQWMTAGRGIIHSEMPQQTEGRMRGFQLWINLPAAEKMKPAAYRDIPAAAIPEVRLPGGGEFRHDLPQGHNAFVYLYEGGLSVGARDPQPLQRRCAGVLGPGVTVTLRASADGARLILLAARPLNEPVAQYGPFVMNTREELEQAVRDYQSGRLTA